MELFKNYLDEIESRKQQSLKPKPIDDGSLLKDIIFRYSFHVIVKLFLKHI